MTTTNLGKVAVVPKGEYSSAVQYERLDIVQYERSSYLVKQAVIGVTPTDGANYALLAGKGDSSYDVAVNNGFIGTEEEWKLYLKSDGSIQALQQFMTNPASTEVSVPDYGNIPSLQGYISTMFENGGLPAEPFATKALMESSSLADGDYAMVTDDSDFSLNGFYRKSGGDFVQPRYAPMSAPVLINVETNLNTLNKVGTYVTTASGFAKLSLNYPLEGKYGILRVTNVKKSSLVIHEFLAVAESSRYLRVFNGVTWSAWTKEVSDAQINALVDSRLSDYAKKADVQNNGALLTASDNLNDLKLNSIRITNIAHTNWQELNYPEFDFGVLEIFKNPSSSLVYQRYSSRGSVYARTWNSVKWSDWIKFGATASGGSNDLIYFDKTSDTLTITQPSSQGVNSIQYVLKHQQRPDIQLDAWGINSCKEVKPSGTLVKNITSSGVWETALVDLENVGDHSGGTHGDEILTNAYFMVDGIYYDQDFVLAGSAREIKFYQKSTIYVENAVIPICNKELVWTFTKDGMNMQQKLTFPNQRELANAWVAMLPVLRKTNQDNTGAQVTDTEIRSQDGVVIDVSEPLFAMRELPITTGDSISLSSSVSGISTQLVINELTVTDSPYAFVQNTAPYNKIYVSAKPSIGGRIVPAGTTWTIDADFKINTRN